MKPAKIIVTSLLLLIGFYSPGSVAESGGFYTVVQYSLLNFREERGAENNDADLKPKAAVLRVGKYFTEHIGVEARLGTGLSSDEERLPAYLGGDVKIEIDSIYGIHLAIGKSFEEVSPYFLLGYTWIDATLDSESSDDSGLSYGFGASFAVADATEIDVEYLIYLDEGDGRDEDRYQAVGLGIRFFF